MYVYVFVGVDSSNMENIHERVFHLRDVALGLRKSVQVNSVLAPASYDCAVDSLLALYAECNQVASLAKDKHVGRFLGKCKTHAERPCIKQESSILEYRNVQFLLERKPPTSCVYNSHCFL